MARRIVIVTARTRADPHEDCAMRCEEVLMRIKQEVQEQEQERESEDEEEGTCFGIAISGPIVALVALNCGQHAAPVRTLHVCDFSDPDGDVWEAIALALHIIHARNDHYGRFSACRLILSRTSTPIFTYASHTLRNHECIL